MPKVPRSTSPQASMAKQATPPVVVLADAWWGPVLCAELKRVGVETALWTPETLSESPEPVAVTVGNGDTFERTRQSMGSVVAERLWAVSNANYQLCRERLRWWGVGFSERGVARDAGAPVEPGLSFLGRDLCRVLHSDHPTQGTFHNVQAVGANGLDPWVVVGTGAGEKTLRGQAVVLATERYEMHALPAMETVRIPVTLTSVCARDIRMPTGWAGASLSFFNAGADFVVVHGENVRLGSYRNLYSDRGVGVYSQPDSLTLKSLQKYFEPLGFWPGEGRWHPAVSVESLSCDGLPVVGSVASAVGLFYVTGFAARAPNFMFEVARGLAAGLSGAKVETGLGLFSPSRFL